MLKWLALVRLLLSDVPERTELTSPGLATALRPYFELTNAVRTGDLANFGCATWARFWLAVHACELSYTLGTSPTRCSLRRCAALQWMSRPADRCRKAAQRRRDIGSHKHVSALLLGLLHSSSTTVESLHRWLCTIEAAERHRGAWLPHVKTLQRCCGRPVLPDAVCTRS